uniref:Uncharacterized protein n=1 Tax=Oryza nivara TaxID=4536 RepID=A0A0E0H2S8_ORYNI
MEMEDIENVLGLARLTGGEAPSGLRLPLAAVAGRCRSPSAGAVRASSCHHRRFAGRRALARCLRRPPA